MMSLRVCLLGLMLHGCMPAPVQALDGWLTAFAASDRATLLDRTRPADRKQLALALDALRVSRTSSLALALPPRPLGHEVLQVTKKGDDRWVIETSLTLENPLPSSSRKIGQPLPGLPETRTQRRGFVVVRGGETWGLKLDLERVVKRSALAEEALAAIARGRFTRARALLDGDFPPPPDDGFGQTGTDRLVDELKRRLEEAQARTSTASAASAD